MRFARLATLILLILGISSPALSGPRAPAQRHLPGTTRGACTSSFTAASPCSSATMSRLWSIRTTARTRTFTTSPAGTSLAPPLSWRTQSPPAQESRPSPTARSCCCRSAICAMSSITGVKLDAASPNVTGITGVREVRSIRDLPGILGERGLRAVWTQLDSDPREERAGLHSKQPRQRRDRRRPGCSRADQDAALHQGRRRDRAAAQGRKRLHQGPGGSHPRDPSRRQRARHLRRNYRHPAGQWLRAALLSLDRGQWPQFHRAALHGRRCASCRAAMWS